MGISEELLYQLAKVTNAKTKSKKETTVYGTIVEQDGVKYIRIDGSSLLTPIYTTADTKNGDRVIAMIKNHSLVVTGNITSPSARQQAVVEVSNSIIDITHHLNDRNNPHEVTATQVMYKNDDSELPSSTVQEAIDTLALLVNAAGTNVGEFGNVITDLISRVETAEATVADMKATIDSLNFTVNTVTGNLEMNKE